MQSDKLGAIIIEGHVQGLANLRALGREGIPCIVVDKNDCIARHSKYCIRFYRCPDYSDDYFADFLLQLAGDKGLIGWILLPSNDHAVRALVKNQERLKSVFKFFAPQKEIFEQIYDKSKLLSLAQNLGIPIPNTEFFSSSNPQRVNLQFPTITKGKQGLTFYKTVGKKAILARDPAELWYSLKSLETFISLSETFTQEVIPYDGTNKTISFTSFSVDGRIQAYWMGIKLREHPLQFGTATFCESVYQQECLDYSTLLMRELNYSGVCEIEFLRDPRDGLFKLIEINARTWLWVGLAIACGVNYPRYIYNHFNGITSVYPSSYPTGYKWRNYWTDKYFSIQALLTRSLSLSEYHTSFVNSIIIDAVRDKDDPKPFRAMTRKLLVLIMSR